jgi:hypothetical protein
MPNSLRKLLEDVAGDPNSVSARRDLQNRRRLGAERFNRIMTPVDYCSHAKDQPGHFSSARVLPKRG